MSATPVPSLPGTRGDLCWVDGAVPVWPVNNNLPNAPTSSAVRVPGAEAGLSPGSTTPGPKSRRVFWNGFGGGRWTGTGWAPSSLSDTSAEPAAEARAKGSFCSSVSSLLLLLLLSSSSRPTGGKRTEASGDSGDEGGGDCTRTLFTTLGFWKLVAGGGWFDVDSVWSSLRKRSAGGRAGALSGVGFGGVSSSSNGGRSGGGAGGAEPAGALRRNGLLELNEAMAAAAAAAAGMARRGNGKIRQRSNSSSGTGTAGSWSYDASQSPMAVGRVSEPGSASDSTDRTNRGRRL